MSSSDEKRPLGKILLQRKLVSQQELDAALRAQKRSGTPAPLASQLIDDGTVGEVDALRALSEQYGVPGIDLTQIAILLEHLDLVPRELAETNRILPVLVRGDRIFLADGRPAREARGRRARVRHRQEGLLVHRGPLDADQGDLRRVRRQGAGRTSLPGTAGPRRDAAPARLAAPWRSADRADRSDRAAAGAARARARGGVRRERRDLGGLDQRVRHHRRRGVERDRLARRAAHASGGGRERGRCRPREARSGRRRRRRDPHARQAPPDAARATACSRPTAVCSRCASSRTTCPTSSSSTRCCPSFTASTSRAGSRGAPSTAASRSSW